MTEKILLIRNCPSCSKILEYKTESYFKQAIEKNKLCISCAKKSKRLNYTQILTRNCPICNCVMTYINEYNRKNADKNNRCCIKCSAIKKSFDNMGENNPFFGKHHSKETKEKISNFNRNERILSEEWLENARIQIKKFGNKRPLYEIWLEKYGKEIADEKLKSFKEKQSKNNSGDKNSMFGKPSPQGSGNGWSGWYNNWYFRSIRELSYMINIIEANNFIWEVPNKKYKINYKNFDGNNRTYIPDFIINKNEIIEIKPKKLHNSPLVVLKKNAAEIFATNLGMKYSLVDPPILTNEQIIKLYLDEKIKFLPRYEEKFKERYLDAKNNNNNRDTKFG